MSTMKVTTLKNEASSVDNIVLNSDGSVGGELGSTLASKPAATYASSARGGGGTDGNGGSGGSGVVIVRVKV